MRKLLTALMFAGMLHGCASTRMRDALTELRDSVEGYNESFRWKNFERAAMYVPSDLRAAFLATYEEDENSLHVEDYQIVEVKMENEQSAVVTVRMRYMMLPSVTVEKASLVQHWRKIEGTWTLETEEGSIRELAVDKKPRNPEAFGRDSEEVEDPSAKTSMEVRDPKGRTLKKVGEIDESEGDD